MDIENNKTASVNESESVILPEAGSLVLSTSPHVQDGDSVSKIMFKVILCLVPIMAASIYFFGFEALRVLLVTTVSAMVFELLWCLSTKRPQTVTDWSAAVTGIILALNLPANAPWWLCVTGSFIAVIVAKEIFGGLGQNPFNPAAVARVALLIGFAGAMTNFPDTVNPDIITGATPLTTAKYLSQTPLADLTTGATPVVAPGTGKFYSLTSHYGAFFMGDMKGSMGETCKLAILIGGLGLMFFRLIKWQIPLAMLGTTFIFTWIVNLAAPELTPGPVFHLMTGGMMIGAFFMATDMVTSPMTNMGAFIFGAAIGLISCVIRIWGAYPEGVSFAIVIMNALVPLIDRMCYRRPFGWTSTSASALNMRRGEIK